MAMPYLAEKNGVITAFVILTVALIYLHLG